MRQEQILAAAAFLLIGGAQAVYAHGLIRSNDSDGDGKLSWAEIEPTGWDRKTFDIKDMNGDSFITEQDLWNHVAWTERPAQNPEIIAAMDKGQDGKVQADEWWWDDASFKRYDKDADGALDAKELSAIPKAKPKASFVKPLVPETLMGFKGTLHGRVIRNDEAGGEALVVRIEKIEPATDSKAAKAPSAVGQEVMINPQWEAPDGQNWQPIPAQTAAVKALKIGQAVSVPVHNDEGWRLHLTGLPKRTAKAKP